MEFYKQKIDSILSEFNSSADEGLSCAAVQAAKKKYGSNQIKFKNKPWWKVVIEPFVDIFVLILLAAVIISLFAGEYVDGIIVGIVIVVNAVIYWIQRYSTERVLRALKKHTQQEVEVKRQNKTLKILADDLVPGDIVFIGEGQKIAADIRILEFESLAVDESSLTGENVPVHKHSSHIELDQPIYKQQNMLFQGTFAISGNATGIVVAIGNDTEFGRLAAMSKPDELSPMQKKINKLVSLIIKIVAGSSTVVFILSLLRGSEPNEALRFMLTMTVSAVPEGLPIALTVILVIGMKRMASKKALVRNMHAVENMGLISVIATDKTGTLTENKLQVQEIWAPDKSSHDILKLHVYLSADIHEDQESHDPLDIVMAEYSGIIHKPAGHKFVHQFSFVQSIRMSGVLWKSSSGYELNVKGSPEHLLVRCDLSKAERSKAESEMHSLASKGYRVIGIASSKISSPVEKLEDYKSKFRFQGFIAVADPLRKAAIQAINEAQQAGIEVKMITGDHFETAFHIGKQLGLANHQSEVFNSEEFAHKTSLPAAIVNKHTIFARILPEDKLLILNKLKKSQISAMTGDGVNDVPALAAANIGVAMGSGSDIAKEAGDIVLLDDNFATIIKAVREGRVIYSNIRKMLFYEFSTTIGEVMTIIGALIIGLPTPVLAIQILWINLVTGTTMVLPLGLDTAEDDVMKYPPRKMNAPLLDKIIVSRLVFVGITIAVVMLVIFSMLVKKHPVIYAQAIAFTMLVFGQWANSLTSRSERTSAFVRNLKPNYLLLLGFIISLVLQELVLFGPLRTMFHIPEINISDLFVPILTISIAVLAAGELHKLLTYKMKSK